MNKKYIIHTKGTLSLHSALLAIDKWQDEIQKVDTPLVVFTCTEHLANVYDKRVVLAVFTNKQSLRIVAYYEGEVEAISNATETDTI